MIQALLTFIALVLTSMAVLNFVVIPIFDEYDERDESSDGW